MDLVLIRHPAPAVAAGVCYGRSDLPLMEDAGIYAAQLAARVTTQTLPRPLTLWSSPLARCAQVARQLASIMALPVHETDRLAEIDFGTWEMQRWDDIGPAALERWSSDLMHAREHGGESAAMFAARVGEWFDQQDARDGSIWCVTHAGVMRALAARALGTTLASLLARPVALGGIVWLQADDQTDPPTHWRLVQWDQA
jgi:alpha-ribazole phosphatase